MSEKPELILKGGKLANGSYVFENGRYKYIIHCDKTKNVLEVRENGESHPERNPAEQVLRLGLLALYQNFQYPMRKILLAELFCMLAITVQAQFVTIMGETETVVNDTVSTDFNPTDQYDLMKKMMMKTILSKKNGAKASAGYSTDWQMDRSEKRRSSERYRPNRSYSIFLR